MPPSPDLLARRRQLNRQAALRCAVEATKDLNPSLAFVNIKKLSAVFLDWIETGKWEKMDGDQ